MVCGGALWDNGAMTEQTIFYVTDSPEVTEAFLQRLEDDLSEIFHGFCRSHFSSDHPLEYPSLRIIRVPTPAALAEKLFYTDARGKCFLSEAGCGCSLFFLDAEVEGRPLFSHRIEGVPLADWFLSTFPAIPKVLITRRDGDRVHLPTRRWLQKPFSVLQDPPGARERLEHLFLSLWVPRFWDALRHYVRRRAGVSWHTPGHTNGNAFERSPFLHGFHTAFSPMIFRTDLSVSVASLGDLSEPEAHSPLAQAQRQCAEIYGTAQSCFVTNGTSTSNKAMLMTLLRPGETVLLDRNCHKSVHHAVVMAGAVPRYLPARMNERLGVWGPIALADLRAELARVATLPGPARPRMLVMTTCTYEGIVYPVWEIGRLCEEAGVLFYADEAWAPYFAFHPYYSQRLPDGRRLRYNAVSELGGAHVSVQSTHKALAAFSQASMIHVSLRFKHLLEGDRAKPFRWLRRRFHLNGHGSYDKFSHDLHEVLRYWHSTSPHYPTLATLDMAATQMRLEGLRILDERLHWVADFQRRVADLVGRPIHDCFGGLRAIAGNDPVWQADGYFHDPLKMILLFRTPAECTRFKELLKRAHIQWEKSTAVTVLFLITAGTLREHFDSLFRCIRQMREAIGLPEETPGAPHDLSAAIAGQPKVLPRDAALCDGELVPLEASAGRIASQLLVPYPPGIPVFIPGLVITQPMIRVILSVLEREGPEAVHGLFMRGKRPFVEVLNRDEELRVFQLP